MYNRYNKVKSKVGLRENNNMSNYLLKSEQFKLNLTQLSNCRFTNTLVITF